MSDKTTVGVDLPGRTTASELVTGTDLPDAAERHGMQADAEGRVDQTTTQPEAQGMKRPKYAALTKRQQMDIGLNPFAIELMAEAHADKPPVFGDETVMLTATAHNGRPVYMLLSTRRPTLEQFRDWPV